MATPDIESDMAALLASKVGALVVGANLFAGPMRPISSVASACVFVQTFGGINEVDNNGRRRKVHFQALTRAARNDYTGGEAQARAVHDALDLAGRFTGASGTTYIECMAMAALPRYLGPDGEDNEFFSEDFEVWFVDP